MLSAGIHMRVEFAVDSGYGQHLSFEKLHHLMDLLDGKMLGHRGMQIDMCVLAASQGSHLMYRNDFRNPMLIHGAYNLVQ